MASARVRRFVALAVVACGALGLIGATTSGAATGATDPSFVGTYAMRAKDSGSSRFVHAGRFTLHADGTTLGDGLRGGHWSNTDETVTIVLHRSGVTLTMTAVRTKKFGLGSRMRPGTETINGTQSAFLWYAITLS
jgi:hypothetical protein